ncbi:hypothetical protein GCM10010358_75470 [Streptomyces minutiscleroticus]|uniref:Uncharacterized protein n=2 Tax=Streptomyces minutiscleroticus TaxID=68238 RepID=A0A918P2D0_9ACTN|nr:hypothetical protein GCM10010358_75470 [Streptomyces minutiscleroticus]
MPYIEEYVRADGTRVRRHYRWAAGARREMTIVAAAALAVVGFGNTSTQAGHATSPRPGTGPDVTYPIRFDQADDHAPKVSVPRPTVSYPITFDTPKTKPPAPQPSVSYPIDFSTMGTTR